MKARFQIEPRDDGWTLTCYYAADDVAFRAYFPDYDEAQEEADRFMEREERFQETLREQQQDVGAVREAPLQEAPMQAEMLAEMLAVMRDMHRRQGSILRQLQKVADYMEVWDMMLARRDYKKSAAL